MGKLALLSVTAALLLHAESFAFAQANTPSSPPATLGVKTSAEAPNRIVGYTAWDDDYFYIALQINKPKVSGKSVSAFSNPLQDDAAILCLQTDNDHKAVQRTEHTFVVAVSGTGGSQLYSGPNATPLFAGLDDFNKQLQAVIKNEKDPAVLQVKQEALLRSLLKFQVEPKGASLPGGGNVSGYTLELAIPWRDLGGRPEPGAKMGFLVAAQSIVPGSPALQSLSPKVRGESDLSNPSLWSQILFSNSPAAAAEGTLICPRIFANKPVVDGELGSGEWNSLTAFEFGERVSATGGIGLLANTLAARFRPEFKPNGPRPVVPLPASDAEPPTLSPRHPQKVAPLVLARYVYWYQADTRKAAPAQNVLRPDGSVALVHQPMEGVGPWLSYDRLNWHRRQLQDIRRAGIDVILPDYRGAPRDRQLYADKGLLVLAAALNSLRQAGLDYPQVALYLDTNALIEVFGDRPDLRDAATQSALYAMIRDFYRHIPAAFRCAVPLSAENGGRVAYPVFLSEAGAFKEMDSSFVAFLRSRFAADFDGADLILLGGSDFKPKAALDGYFTLPREKSFQFTEGGWIKLAAVSPGYDTTMGAGIEKPILRPRRDGDTYKSDWTAALGKHLDWVLIDSWNDYGNGTELAPTLQTGFSYADMTKFYVRQFEGNAQRSGKFLWHNAPSLMLAQATYSVQARAQNTGTVSWANVAGSLPMAFAYRWRRGGQILATGAATPLPGPVIPGQNVSATLRVAASGANGAALAEGDYTLEIGAVETGRGNAVASWPDDATGGATLQIPIKVRAANTLPAWAATLVSTDLPTTLESGSVYDVNATIRNDGATPWRKADGARITLRLYKEQETAEGEKGRRGEGEVVATADATAELAQDVLPGQEATVRLILPLTDPQGQPLPLWSQDALWTYTARWEIAADHASPSLQPASVGDSGAASLAHGVSVAPTPLAVVNFDFGAKFLVDATPNSLPGERRLPIRLSLQNVGPQTWRKENVRVGYHWYYLDGTEFLWEDETTPITQDVPSGGRIRDMLAWITAPPYDGTYWLVWDVKVGDTWASTSESASVFDETVRQVEVIRGRLNFADLSKAYNISGITEDTDTASGNLDGLGRTFPALLTPPFASTAIVPSGVGLPSTRTGPDSPRRISFRWGPKGPKEKNFISCVGQKIALGKSGDQCRLLHILAASTGKEAFPDMKLIFQEPTGQSEDLYTFPVSRWDVPPTHGELIGFLARRHHERSGVQPGALALYHYVIQIKQPRKLVAIQLPNLPDVKIAAITLEK